MEAGLRSFDRTMPEEIGTLVGPGPRWIAAEAGKVLDGGGKTDRIPALRDGHAADRIPGAFRRFGVERGLVRG
jgi:hypothetical protein